MFKPWLFLLFGGLAACAGAPVAPPPTTQADAAPLHCPGSSGVPARLREQLQAVEDPALLRAALGQPGQGGLCQGQVYQSRPDSQVTLFRVWNSTNPHSQYGSWWALELPVGEVSAYRAGFEICYQWSPLDRLATCSLKPGARLVLGDGQSASCSAHLTYPPSPRQQVFIQDAASAVTDCSVHTAKFNWLP